MAALPEGKPSYVTKKKVNLFFLFKEVMKRRRKPSQKRKANPSKNLERIW